MYCERGVDNVHFNVSVKKKLLDCNFVITMDRESLNQTESGLKNDEYSKELKDNIFSAMPTLIINQFDGIKPVICQQCGDACANEEILRIHICNQATNRLFDGKNSKTSSKNETDIPSLKKTMRDCYVRLFDCVASTDGSYSTLRPQPSEVLNYDTRCDLQTYEDRRNTDMYDSDGRRVLLENTDDAYVSNEDHKCQKCKFVFKSRAEWKQHVCDYVESFKYGLCGGTRSSLSSSHENACQHSHNQCDSFVDVDNLQQHSLSGTENTECLLEDSCIDEVCVTDDHGSAIGAEPINNKLYICEKCSSSFTRHRHLRRHIEEAHPVRSDFKCSKCESSFSRLDDFQGHLLVHAASSPSKHFANNIMQNENTYTYNSYESSSCDKNLQHNATTESNGQRQDVSNKSQKNGGEEVSMVHNSLSSGGTLIVCKTSDENFAERSLNYFQRDHDTLANSSECSRGEPTILYGRTLAMTEGANQLVSDVQPSFFVDRQNKQNLAHQEQLSTTKFLGETYSCHLCDSVFKRHASLKQHLRLHAEPHKCGECGETFSTDCDFQEHCQVHTSEPFKCDICDASFADLESLQKHSRSHEMDRDYTLEDDCKSAASVLHAVHPGNKQYSCGQCPASFAGSCDLRRHYRQVHPILKPFKCLQCGSSFARLELFMEHLRVHTSQNSPRSSVNNRFVPNLTSSNKTLIGEHNGTSESIHHLQHVVNRFTVPVKFTCHFCDLSFTSESDLREHYHLHVGNSVGHTKRLDDHPHSSVGINRSEATANINSENETPLWGIKPIPKANTVETINSQNDDKSVSLEQQNALPNVSAEKLYTDQECEVGFKRNSVLKQQLPTRQEPYKCNKCGHTFFSLLALKEHVRDHRKKLYKSDSCGTSFADQGHLKRHCEMHDKGDDNLVEQSRTVDDFEPDLSVLHANRSCKHAYTKCPSSFTRSSRLHIGKSPFAQGQDLQDQSQPVTGSNNAQAVVDILGEQGTPLWDSEASPELNGCDNMPQKEPTKNQNCDESVSLAHQNPSLIILAEEVYKCQECEAVFKRSSGLKQHLRIHLEPYKCDECGDRFPTESDLQEHAFDHSNNESYECDSDAGVDGQSEESHSEGDGSCAKFTQRTKMKIYRCKNCAASCDRKCNLTRHTFTHTNVKRFKCSKCDSSFSRSDHLKQHSLHHARRDLSNPDPLSNLSGKNKENLCNTENGVNGPLVNIAIEVDVKSSVMQNTVNASNNITSNISEQDSTCTDYSLQLESHIQTEIPGGFKCSYCDVLFSFESELKLHACLHVANCFGKEKLEDNFIVSSNDCATHIFKPFVETDAIAGKLDDKQGNMPLVNNDNSLYKCKCGDVFTTQSLLEEHAAKHVKLIPNNLSTCEKNDDNYKSSPSLATDDTVPITPKEYKCEICNCTYSTESELQMHNCLYVAKNIYEENLLKVQLLNDSAEATKKSEQKENCAITKHSTCEKMDDLSMIVPYVTDDNLYKCPYCANIFRKVDAFEAHCRIHVGHVKYRCKCGSVFATESFLEKHAANHLGPTSLFTCKECGKSFQARHKFVAHQLVHSTSKPFKCEICERHFVTKSKLATHARSHILSAVCKVCGKGFSTEKALETHNLVHTGEKPLQCFLCPAAFARPQSLKIHLRRHMGIKPYKCKVCGAAFAENKALETHASSHSKERKFMCEFCGAAFRSKNTLRTHRRHLHTNVNPHKCTVCGACFTMKQNLNRHMFVHTGERPYKCAECSSAFTQKEHLKKHLRTMHV